MRQQFDLLNEKEQNTILNLHFEKKESEKLEEKLLDIFECNGIEIVPIKSVALYSTIPR